MYMKIYTFLLSLFVISCTSSITNNDINDSNTSTELPNVTTTHGAENFSVQTTINSNQWIDFDWSDFKTHLEESNEYEPASYKFFAHEQTGPSQISQVTSHTTARAYPKEDPYGNFLKFDYGFGFADFWVVAYNNSGQEIARTNRVSFKTVQEDESCVFCGDIHLCDDIEFGPDIRQGGECAE